MNPESLNWLQSISGIAGEVLMFTSIYLVMRWQRSGFRHALIGGITRRGAWEITRRVLIWYYATVTMVKSVI